MKKLSDASNKMREQTKRYVRENWGFPFIAGFILLLFAAAVLLAGGMVSVAEPIATIAYLVLVFGVVLQLCSGKKRGNDGAVVHGPD